MNNSPLQAACGSAGHVADAENPGEKQHECHMDADRRAGDRSDIQ